MGVLALIFTKGEFQSHRHQYWRKADGLFSPEVLDLPSARSGNPWPWVVSGTRGYRIADPEAPLGLWCMVRAGAPAHLVPLRHLCQVFTHQTPNAAKRRTGEIICLSLQTLQRKDQMVPCGLETCVSGHCSTFLCNFKRIILCGSCSS